MGNNNAKKQSNFIMLDRDLLRVLGTNEAIVLCQYMNAAEVLKNNPSNKQGDFFYQTEEQIAFYTGLSISSVNRAKNVLIEKGLIVFAKHTEKNRTKFKLNTGNISRLQAIAREVLKEETKKTYNAIKLKRQVISDRYDKCYQIDSTEDNVFKRTKEDNKIMGNMDKRENGNYLIIEEFKQQFPYFAYSTNFLSNTRLSVINKFLDESNKYGDNVRFALGNIEYYLMYYKMTYNECHVTFKDAEQLENILYKMLAAEQSTDESMGDIIFYWFTKMDNIDSNKTLLLFLSQDENDNFNFIDKIACRIEGLS